MYHANIEYINRPRAEQMLVKNYDGNRRLRETYVAQLAEVMRQGRFVSENGQTIVVGDDDGVTYDGQHRLEAIVRADVGYNFIVAYITEGKEKFKTIDGGTSRKAADFIMLPDKNACAAVAKRMACVEWGHAPLLSCLQGRWETDVRIDRGMVVLYCEQYPEKVMRAVRLGRRMRDSASCGSQSDYATMIMLVELFDEHANAEGFVDDFCELSPGNRTVSALKGMVMRAHMKASGKPDSKWMVGTMLDAYQHYVERDDSTMLNKQQMRLKDYQKRLESFRADKEKAK